MKKFLFASAFALGFVFFMACSKEDTTNATTSEVSAQAATSNPTSNGLTAEDRSGLCQVTINYTNDGPCGAGEFYVVLWITPPSGIPYPYILTNAGVLDPNGSWISHASPANGKIGFYIPLANGPIDIIINGDPMDPTVNGSQPWVNYGASLDLDFSTKYNTGTPYHLDGAGCDCQNSPNACTSYGNNEVRTIQLCQFQ
jgi:hypothetical protein